MFDQTVKHVCTLWQVEGNVKNYNFFKLHACIEKININV